MAIRNWLTIAAILYAVLGLGLLLAPGETPAAIGLHLDRGGAVVARILGASLTTLAAAFWLYRKQTKGARPLMIGNLAYNIIGFFVVVAATTGATLNVMGWVLALVHVILTGGFAYCLFGVASPRRR